MACTSPIRAWQRRKDRQMFFNEPARGQAFLYDAMEVPCQQCLDCKVRRTSDWSLRIMHEVSMHERNCVVTLTYDQEHLPHRWQLREVDTRLFIRRVRRRFPDAHAGYGYCGEYGDGGRPHYHMIFFGLDFPDKVYWSKSKSGSKLWTSKICTDLWGLGIAQVGEVDKATADYVASYCVKKMTGDRAKAHYARVDRETGEVYQLVPEFFRVSKGRSRPGEVLAFGKGIGARWLEKFGPSDVFPWDKVILRGGAEKRPPRYYDKVLKRTDRARYEAVKAARAEAAKSPQCLVESTPERRSVRAQVTAARLAFRKRQL